MTKAKPGTAATSCEASMAELKAMNATTPTPVEERILPQNSLQHNQSADPQGVEASSATSRDATPRGTQSTLAAEPSRMHLDGKRFEGWSLRASVCAPTLHFAPTQGQGLENLAPGIEHHVGRRCTLHRVH